MEIKIEDLCSNSSSKTHEKNKILTHKRYALESFNFNISRLIVYVEKGKYQYQEAIWVLRHQAKQEAPMLYL